MRAKGSREPAKGRNELSELEERVSLGWVSRAANKGAHSSGRLLCLSADFVLVGMTPGGHVS